MEVKNYRSLRDVTIGSLSPLVVLYGENDTGKSNILSFLSHVFQRKYIEEVIEVPGEEPHVSRIEQFWRGRIEDFSDNYFQNTYEPITFSILIRFERSEIRAIPSLPKAFIAELSPRSHYDHLRIDGRIEPLSADLADMVLLGAEFDQKRFYDVNSEGVPEFLPDFGLRPGQARDAFDRIMAKLDDSFLRIPTSRFLTAEDELIRSKQALLQADSFKNWLFQSGLNRETEYIFRQITERFGNPPFEHGRISIARVSDNKIEIFIEDDKGFKLPIGRKGSGVQQILMVLSYVVQSRSPIIGIEELEINLSPKTQSDIFNILHELVNTPDSPVSQVFLTTHSPHIARRNEAQRRGVWIENGETQVKKPSEAQVEDFFRFPFASSWPG